MAKMDCGHAENNPVYRELRQIYGCIGAEFCRPTLEKAWREIERLERKVALADELATALAIVAKQIGKAELEAVTFGGKVAAWLAHQDCLTIKAAIAKHKAAKQGMGGKARGRGEYGT